MPDQASARVSPVSPAPVSPKKLRANRRNARKSTGPRTAEGKAVACRNATTHGLFCRDLVLPGEEADRFHFLRESILRALKPQDAMELALVDRLVCDQWRLNRLQRAEMALYAHRDEQLRDHRRKELEKLQRDFRFEDATSACQVASHLVKDFARYRELREQLEADPAPAAQLAAAMLTDDPAFERLSRYEQRLQHGVHRCLRDLHALRAKAKLYADLPESPFLAREEDVGPQDDLPPSPRTRGEGGGEGPAARGVDDGSIRSAATDHPIERPPAATRTSPLSPTLSPSTERGSSGSAREPIVQNEPTAAPGAASPVPATGCGAPPQLPATAGAAPCHPEGSGSDLRDLGREPRAAADQ